MLLFSLNTDFATGRTCEQDIDGCASQPCGNRTCVNLTPQEQANGTQGYRCECMPSEIEVNGLCLRKKSVSFQTFSVFIASGPMWCNRQTIPTTVNYLFPYARIFPGNSMICHTWGMFWAATLYSGTFGCKFHNSKYIRCNIWQVGIFWPTR